MNIVKLKKEEDVTIITLPKNIQFTPSLVKELESIINSNIQLAEINVNNSTPKLNQIKKPNTTYSVGINNRLFNSSKMSENYINAIKYLIQNDNSIIPIILKLLNNYVKTNPNDFKIPTQKISTIAKISDNLYISTYSDTNTKKEHLQKISDAINIPILLEKIK